MKVKQIYSYIDALIQQFLANRNVQPTLESNDTVQINGKTFELHIWHENIDNQSMQIFELKNKGWFFDTVYTKGVLLSNDSYKILSIEDMWLHGF